MTEDYPSNFNMEEFKKLNSFSKRIEYCNQNLKRITSGSARVIFMIDSEKVLKLAKNKKGLAQNEIEASFSNYHDIEDIVAKTFDYADDNTWIEMELARKVTPTIFKQLTGFKWEDYIKNMRNHYYRVNPSKSPYLRVPETTETEKEMWEDSHIYQFLSFLGNYDVPVDDLVRLNSYGVVKRYGQDTIALIDYGLTNDVYDSYYK